MELTQELKKEFQNYDQDGLNKAFIDACTKGHLDIIKYLLTAPNLKEHAYIHANNDLGFRKSCEYGHLEVIKYLLTSPDLTDHADIHAENDSGLRWACAHGHLDVLKYLLTSPDLVEHANIHVENNLSFRLACVNRHLNVVEYLLTSSDLKEHADIHAVDDGGFQVACKILDLEIIIYLLSFNGYQCIDFQRTDHNLDWAMENKYNNVIIAMMKNLKNNNPFDYMEWLPKIKAYHTKLYEHVKNIETESLEVNSSVPELFL